MEIRFSGLELIGWPFHRLARHQHVVGHKGCGPVPLAAQQQHREWQCL
jgi:hypothetical protein